MSLADGDRPADGDVWFRVLTSQSHIAKGGRVNHAAFKGNFMRAPKPSSNRPWDAEQLTADAETYCTRYSTKFFGMMFPKRPLAGTVLESLTLDFRYTPILNDDIAHADLTFTGNIPTEKTEEHEKLVLALVESFSAIGTGQMELLPPANIKPPSLAERLHQALIAAFPKRPSEHTPLCLSDERKSPSPSAQGPFDHIDRQRWQVELVRVKGGEPHSWIVEACDAQGRLGLPAALADQPAAAEGPRRAATG